MSMMPMQGPNLLESLAYGLRAAGGTLSPGAFQANQQMEREQLAMDERRKTLAMAQVIRGIESGAIPAEQGQQYLQGLGMNAPVGPSPEAQARIADVRAQEELRRLAPTFKKDDGTFDRDALLSYVAQRDPMKAAQYGKILGVSGDQKPIAVAPGTVLLDPVTRRPIYTNEKQERPAQASPLGRLLAERDVLPEGDPRRALYDRAIANESTREKGIKVEVNNNPMPLGKPAQNKVDESLLDNTEVLQGLSQIEKQFKPEYQQIGTRWKNLTSATKEKVGFTLDPNDKKQLEEFSSYKRNSIDNLNKYIKAITGAAMSISEAERITKGMPNAGTGLFDGDSPTEFKAKMDDAIKQTKMAVARLEYMKRNGMKLTRDDGEFAIPLDRMPGLIRRRGAEMEAEIRSINPTWDKDQVQEATARRLASEFGLVQ